MFSQDPLQLTLGNFKLSLEPSRSGPILEFTDYGTDITWLSGRIHVAATVTGIPRLSHIALENVTWFGTDDGITIQGNIAHADIELNYKLLDDPVRLEEKITISFQSEKPVGFDVFRIGLSWSPPESWWQYWSYWNLFRLKPGEDEFDPSSMPVEKFNEIKERLSNEKNKTGMCSMRVDIEGCAGWIFSDDRRFLLVFRSSNGRERKRDEKCPLDVIDSKPSPTFIMGGEDNNEGIETVTTTTFIPGSGGCGEGYRKLQNYQM